MIRILASLPMWTVTLGLLPGCGGDSAKPAAADATGAAADTGTTSDDVAVDTTPPPNISPEAGGSVTSADGRLRLDFPPGAVKTAVNVTVTALAPAEAPPETFPAGIAYRLEPSGLQLDVPARVSFTFSRAEMAAAAAALLDPAPEGAAGTDYFLPVVLWSIADDGTASPLANQSADTTVAGEELTVQGDASHFSEVEQRLEHVLLFAGPKALTLDVGASSEVYVAADVEQYRDPFPVQVVEAKFFPGPTAFAPLVISAPTGLPTTFGSGSYVRTAATCTAPGEGSWSVSISGNLQDDPERPFGPEQLGGTYRCVPPPTCDDVVVQGVVGEGQPNYPGPFDYRQTCEGRCPEPMRGGGAPGSPCTSSTECAEVCCECSASPDYPQRYYTAAACLGGICRYPETVCHVVRDYLPEGEPDPCP